MRCGGMSSVFCLLGQDWEFGSGCTPGGMCDGMVAFSVGSLLYDGSWC